MKLPNLENLSSLAEAASFSAASATPMAARRAAPASPPQAPTETGRHLLVFPNEAGAAAAASQLLSRRAGLRVASTRDFSLPVTEASLGDVDALLYHDLGVALVDGDLRQLEILGQAMGLLQPEKVVFVPDQPAAAAQSAPHPNATWGIAQTRALQSSYSGKGVKVAVLDTGFDSAHPDFAGRSITAQSFVPDQPVADVFGHGTHCVGSACGHLDAQGLRYGVATGADILVGKVLADNGRGAQAWILSGLAWAVSQGSRVISLSLSSPVPASKFVSYDPAYEQAAQYALANNCVVLAAAGNNSQRRQLISPVGSPANCPSVLAVAAVDAQLGVAPFSCGAVNADQLVALAGPGVNVYSSWPMPTRYNTLSGTSQATPHAAGIAALLWEKYPTFTAAAIIKELRALAIAPNAPASDFGSGFVQAP